MADNNNIDFGGGIKKPIIKVVGVGGGGCVAVKHMYREGIHDVSFLLCNTDSYHLNNSPVPSLQLGKKGLGAGNCPERARQATEEEEFLRKVQEEEEVERHEKEEEGKNKPSIGKKISQWFKSILKEED